MSAKLIRRITLFKVLKDEDQQLLLGKYRTMPETAVKGGKPYILSVHAGPAFKDQGAQGYTVAVLSVFSSEEGMVYYDNECAAHSSSTALAKSVHQGVLMAYFESIFD